MDDNTNLSSIQKNAKPAEVLLKDLRSANLSESINAGQSLLRASALSGLTIPDYLRLAVKTSEGEFKGSGLDGYEATLAHLNLPFQNDFSKGVLLQAASDTFATYPGTRMMFPAVMDEILRFSVRQNSIENPSQIVSGSRTIAGSEQISVVMDDDTAATQTALVSEGGKIPISEVRSSEQTVRMFKHGGGYRFTYEFGRRASLDILTPFAARTARRLELSKMKAAIDMLINGDGVTGHGAAPVVRQQADFGGTGTTLLEYKPLLKWIVSRAKANAPIDIVIGNYEMYVEWLLLFTPNVNNRADAEAIAAAGGPTLRAQVPGLLNPIDFVVATAVPDNKLIGITKAETLQELIEANSQIQETERAITTQQITVVKTENAGYKLVFGDTRSIYNRAA